jgi:hypothetical protein
VEYIQDISWEEIERQWKAGEEPVWHDIYSKKGLKNWEEWRMGRANMMHLPERLWTLEKPENVIAEVRQMFCDASTVWSKFYEDRAESDFGHLKDHTFFRTHPRVLAMRENFRSESPIIGLKNQGKIIVIDGHHRATAIAGMDAGQSPQVTFALTELDESDFKKIYEGGRVLKLEKLIYDGINVVRRRIGLV